MRALIAIVTTFALLAGCKNAGDVSQTATVKKGQGADGSSFAWFTHPERSVAYCLRVAPAFPVAEVDVKRVIDEALGAWKRYFTARQAAAGRINALTYRSVDDCEQSDVKFYFGIRGPEIIAANQSLDDVIAGYEAPAFSYQIGWDLLTGWSSGLVWVTDDPRYDWQHDDHQALKAAVVHELGHVFGYSHTPGTIMDRNLGEMLLDPIRYGAEIRYLDATSVLAHYEHYDAVWAPESIEEQKNLQNLRKFMDPGAPLAADGLTSQLLIDSGFYKLVIDDGNEKHIFNLNVYNDTIDGKGFSVKFSVADIYRVSTLYYSDKDSKPNPNHEDIKVNDPRQFEIGLSDSFSDVKLARIGNLPAYVQIETNPEVQESPLVVSFIREDTGEMFEVFKGPKFYQSEF